MARRVGFAFQLMRGEGWKGALGEMFSRLLTKDSALCRGGRSELAGTGWRPEATAPNPSQVSLCGARSLRGPIGRDREVHFLRPEYSKYSCL